jgi:hypothetical protein
MKRGGSLEAALARHGAFPGKIEMPRERLSPASAGNVRFAIGRPCATGDYRLPTLAAGAIWV